MDSKTIKNCKVVKVHKHLLVPKIAQWASPLSLCEGTEAKRPALEQKRWRSRPRVCHRPPICVWWLPGMAGFSRHLSLLMNTMSVRFKHPGFCIYGLHRLLANLFDETISRYARRCGCSLASWRHIYKFKNYIYTNWNYLQNNWNLTIYKKFKESPSQKISQVRAKSVEEQMACYRPKHKQNETQVQNVMMSLCRVTRHKISSSVLNPWTVHQMSFWLVGHRKCDGQ